MLSRRGSLWNKWDLHIHTPASLVHHYPGTPDIAWESFLADLEALPSSFKAIGINDYLFLDGYERVRKEKKAGRLKNIDLILPVIEIRLALFGGSDSHLSRVNLHVLFSDELEPDAIVEQFIRALTCQFTLNPLYISNSSVQTAWKGVISPESLRDLGAAIIASVPESERHRYDSPLLEGFRNLTLTLDQVRHALSSTFLKDRYLIAVGKTEWANVRWKDGSIADKKNIINSADIVFIAAESAAAYERSRQALHDSGVNARLLDCSDAHSLASSDHKDRIGNCATWIKAALTFGGLRQAMAEFTRRVFVGTEPSDLTRLREHPSRFIDSVRISKVSDSTLADTWFDVDVPLHMGLVAVIGNKGSGKSALVESIGLAARSQRADQFSFLRTTKFREPRRNPAAHFLVRLLWADGQESESRLSGVVAEGATVLAQVLPQQYLEHLCNEIPGGDKSEFDKQLEAMIFAHLPRDRKLGTASLDELLAIIGRKSATRRAELRAKIGALNERIAGIEASLSEPAQRAARETYASRRREWLELRQSPPEAVAEPSERDPARQATRDRIRELGVAHEHLRERHQGIAQELTQARRLQSDLASFRAELDGLKESHDILLSRSSDLFDTLRLDGSKFQMVVDTPGLDRAEAELASRAEAIAIEHDDADERSLPVVLRSIQQETGVLRSDLSAPEEKYEEYLARRTQWVEAARALLGSAAAPQSLLGLRAEVQKLRGLPALLQELQTQREGLLREVHTQLREEVTEYALLYRPLEEHMRAEAVPDEYKLAIHTSLVDVGFVEGFLKNINRHVSGSFCGIDESQRLVSELSDALDLDDTDAVVEFARSIDDRLHRDYRTPATPDVLPESQVRKGYSIRNVYDYLYCLDYLSPRYGLQFRGKPIHRLSPGEKGVLLLLFFLLADLDTRPLVIDQPEDNLDNQTVFKALVESFYRARSRRQVVVVTHNPNLAVVCDADQIIVASLSDNRIEYTSGPIEDHSINQAVLDILEGTRPAFDNRSTKYDLHAAAPVKRSGVTDPPPA